MNNSTEPSKTPLHGIASLFDDIERKELFKKYLFFLGWMEVLIFAACWIYQLGNGAHDQSGLVELPFPWKTYFLVAFLFPVATTFLLGVVVVGFNKYFAGTEQTGEPSPSPTLGDFQAEGSGRLDKIYWMVGWVQKLPFLGLLLLLAVAVVFFYNLDVLLAFVGNVGEKTIKFILYSVIGLVGIVSIFLMILIVMNYKLRKKSMDYQYRSEVAERFGLIILDDATVLSSDGKLLVNGKKEQKALPLLPGKTTDAKQPTSPATGVLPRPADPEAT